MTRVFGFALLAIGAVLNVCGAWFAVFALIAYGAGLTAAGTWLMNRDRGWGAPGEASWPEGPPPPQGQSRTRTPNRDF